MSPRQRTLRNVRSSVRITRVSLASLVTRKKESLNHRHSNENLNTGTEDDGGNTPIHIAVSVGNARLARELLIRGSYGASWNHDGEAPIHIVAKSGNSKLLKVGSLFSSLFLEVYFIQTPT